MHQQPVYYTSELSATKPGYVGLVIDAKKHRVEMRTAHAYSDRVVAEAAAKKAWEESRGVAA